MFPTSTTRPLRVGFFDLGFFETVRASLRQFGASLKRFKLEATQASLRRLESTCIWRDSDFLWDNSNFFEMIWTSLRRPELLWDSGFCSRRHMTLPTSTSSYRDSDLTSWHCCGRQMLPFPTSPAGGTTSILGKSNTNREENTMFKYYFRAGGPETTAVTPQASLSLSLSLSLPLCQPAHLTHNIPSASTLGIKNTHIS